MSSFTIGIDIGTTGTKAVLFEPGRGIIAQASRPAQLQSPRPGFAEAVPAEWLRNVHESIVEILSSSGVAAVDIQAVSTSGMVPAVVVCDRNGRPLRNAILQNDVRAVAEIGELAAALADVDLVGRTGSALTQQSVAPTAMWLSRNEPDIWANTAIVVGSYDWILIALGAEPHVEQNWAIESGLFELSGDPLTEVLEAAELDPSRVPPLLSSGSVVGAINRATSQATGLAIGTQLVVGGADHVLSAFAAGVERSGDCLVKLGGAGDILVASDRPITDGRIYLDAHPSPGRWLPNGCMATSGSLIRWFQTLVGGPDLTTLDDEAELRSAAEVLCLPYFLGEKSPLHDPNLRGTFVGMHLGHTRADLYRSVLEAVAFGFRHHIEVFSEMGIRPERVMITNGGSKSRLWKQIHSEVLGSEIFPVVDHPGASLGAAIIGAIGIGLINSWEYASESVVLDAPIVPNTEKICVYDESYLLWRELGGAVTPVVHKLALRKHG